jgi:hypothetical protein
VLRLQALLVDFYELKLSPWLAMRLLLYQHILDV